MRVIHAGHAAAVEEYFKYLDDRYKTPQGYLDSGFRVSVRILQKSNELPGPSCKYEVFERLRSYWVLIVSMDVTSRLLAIVPRI